MARKVALTPASIDALQKGLLRDVLTPGLVIEVLANGKKRWRYRRQVGGMNVVAAICVLRKLKCVLDIDAK